MSTPEQKNIIGSAEWKADKTKIINDRLLTCTNSDQREFLLDLLELVPFIEEYPHKVDKKLTFCDKCGELKYKDQHHECQVNAPEQNSAHSYTEGSEPGVNAFDYINFMKKQYGEPSSVEKPEWYSKGEIFDWLKRNDYSDTIANELSGKISILLNGLRKRIDVLLEKEIRADRMIVDLEHEKAVLKAKVQELEEKERQWLKMWGPVIDFCQDGHVKGLEIGDSISKYVLNVLKNRVK